MGKKWVLFLQTHTSRRTSIDSSKTICFRFSPTTTLTSPSFCMGKLNNYEWTNEVQRMNKEGHRSDNSGDSHILVPARSCRDCPPRNLERISAIGAENKDVKSKFSWRDIAIAAYSSQTLTGFTSTIAKYWNVVSILIFENIFSYSEVLILMKEVNYNLFKGVSATSIKWK
jgi:hypothetical protein